MTLSGGAYADVTYDMTTRQKFLTTFYEFYRAGFDLN